MQGEQSSTSKPVAQPAPAAMETTIMPTSVKDNVTDVEVVPLFIRPSVELTR